MTTTPITYHPRIYGKSLLSSRLANSLLLSKAVRFIFHKLSYLLGVTMNIILDIVYNVVRSLIDILEAFLGFIADIGRKK